MADTTWLSIIIPTYNGAQYIGETLNGIVSQAERSVEVIVVDDGSTDETLDIVRGFKSRLSLRLLHSSSPGSWVRSTNLGVEHACGEWISLLHQDDLWEPNRLEILRSLTKRFPEAIAAFHPSTFISSSGKNVGMWSCPFPKNEALLHTSEVFPRLFVQNFIAIPAPLVKADAFRACCPLDDRLWFTADWKLWLSLSLQGSWAYTPMPLARFRLHSRSLTMKGVSLGTDYREQFTLVRDHFVEELRKLSPAFGDIDKAASFSIECNIALAGASRGSVLCLFALLPRFLVLGPRAWWYYLYYSRIIERVASRIRAGVLRSKGAKRSSA